MKIIYYCFAGAHASVVASALHCNLLPAHRIPTYEELLSIPFYDRTPPELIGMPYFMGVDEQQNEIYFMGMWSDRGNISASILTVLELSGISKEEYLLQDAFPLINFSTKLGGLMSKRYSLTRLGRSITVWGIQRQYPAFVRLVNEVKSHLE